MVRSKTSKAWLQRHVNDVYVQRSKSEGWRSRAAFKLIEIDRVDHLLRPGLLVVDLGAAPGGWSQVAASRVGTGTGGRVVGLDLLDMQPIAGVEFLRGDFTDGEVLAALEKTLGGRKVDLVLSDMAPNFSGVAATDQPRAAYLNELALEFARSWLKPDGALLVKVFHGAEFEAFRRAMQQTFRGVVVRKPDASRDSSAEVFLLGRALRPAA